MVFLVVMVVMLVVETTNIIEDDADNCRIVDCDLKEFEWVQYDLS